MNDKEYTYDIDKYTIGVDENGEDGIGLTVAKVENGEICFLGNCYGENARCLDLLIKENQELNDKINKAIDFYETYKQECVIGRTRDEKLIKDYYLPAQLSKDLIKILKGEYNVKQRIKRKIR